MISTELLKFNATQSLVVRIKDDGTIHEYVVCSNYDDNAPEGSKWDWGHYFMTMEGALKYIATECFSPIHKYVLVETDEDNRISEKSFNDYDSVKREFDSKVSRYRDDEACYHRRYYDNGNEVNFYFDDDVNVALKIIDVIV